MKYKHTDSYFKETALSPGKHWLMTELDVWI